MPEPALNYRLKPLRDALQALQQHTLPVKSVRALRDVLAQMDALENQFAEDNEQRRFATLYSVSQMLGQSLRLDEVLNQVMDAVIALTGAERGFLMLHDPETDRLDLQAARNFERENLEKQSMKVSRTVIQNVLDSGEPVLTTNAQADPRFSKQDSVILHALRAIICVPLQTRGSTTGVIYVDNPVQINQFGDEQLDLVNALAAQAAVVIENARLYTQTDQSLAARVAELEALSQINRELNAQLDLEHAVTTTCARAVSGSSAGSAWLAIYQEEARLFERVMETAPRSVYELDDPLVKAAMGQGDPEYQAAEGGRQAKSVFLLSLAGKPVAILVLESQSSLSVEDIEFLQRLSARASVAIENARLYKAVQEANLAKSSFVSIVSHELRLPMTSIQGYTDLILQGAAGHINEPQREFLHVIRNNVERMRVLVSDLSDISRIETGRLRLEPARFSIKEAIHQIESDFRLKLSEKEQTLTIEMPGDLPDFDADVNRVMQVLTNLVSNAWKYMPAGGRIYIRVTNSDRSVRIEVQDEGYGISDSDQARLFTQFFRSDDPKIREQTGWGLGLNVTKQLVELMGGAIGVDSEFGAGSTFWFTLPLD